MLISATHTHSAPASMGCLGTDADPTYVPYLREKLAEAIAAAEKNLEPAQVGWGSIDAGGVHGPAAMDSPPRPRWPKTRSAT